MLTKLISMSPQKLGREIIVFNVLSPQKETIFIKEKKVFARL